MDFTYSTALDARRDFTTNIPEIVQLASPKESKQQAILTTATKLFLKHGYHGTSINKIVAESQIDKALIYYYFQDKADIAYCTFNNIANFYEGHLIQPFKACKLPRRQLAIRFIDELTRLIEAGHIGLIATYDTGLAELPKLQAAIDNHIDSWTNLMSSFVTPIDYANLNEIMTAHVSFELIIAAMRASYKAKNSNSSKICLKRLLKSLWLT